VSDDAGLPAGQRVLVLFEPGRGGAAALGFARDLAEHESAKLTVINVAPQSTTKGGQCCGMTSLREYNEVIRDATAEELREARARLGSAGEGATFTMLVEGTDPPVAEWIGAHDFGLVLLPARRRLFGRATHPEAARLQASIAAEVRVVDPKDRPTVDAHKPSPSALQQASA
jgi:hypothetical protein